MESEHFLGQELSSILTPFPPQLWRVWRGGSGGSWRGIWGVSGGGSGGGWTRSWGSLGRPWILARDPLPTNVYDLGRITGKCQKGDQPFSHGPKAFLLGSQTGLAVRNRIFSNGVTRRMDFPKSGYFPPSREGEIGVWEGCLEGVLGGVLGGSGGCSGVRKCSTFGVEKCSTLG